MEVIMPSFVLRDSAMKSVLIFIFCLNSWACLAQETKTVNYGSFTGAIGSNQGSLSVDFFHLWRLGEARKIEVGVGGRITSYFGSAQYYSSAPAELADVPAKSDSLLLQSPQVNSINLSINIGYRVSAKIGLGFNIDAAGFTLGAEKAGTYLNGNQGSAASAKPTPYNLLLVGHNDHGTLNSEFYLRYFFKEGLGIKVAYQYLFTEYTTNTKVQQAPEPNDRFRNISNLFSLGITKQF